MPSTEIASDDLKRMAKIRILTLLVKTGICSSNRMPELCNSNAISVNDENLLIKKD